MKPVAFLVSLPVRAYRLILSPWVGHGCRFQPTCSVYALEALEKHGALKGTVLAVRRIARCHPLGGSGIDNVPEEVAWRQLLSPADKPGCGPECQPRRHHRPEP